MNCKICNVSDKHKNYLVSEMMLGLREEFDYFECSSCGCLQIKEFPKDMSPYYPNDYYSFSTSANSFTNKLKNLRDTYALTGKGAVGKLINFFFPNFALISIQQLNLSKESRILDIGCGSGKLLQFLNSLGYSNLCGADPFLKKDLKFDNFQIYKKSILEMDEKWDLIMLHHSFEHIPNQKETLEAIKKLLNKNGTCIIRVPTASSWAWEHYRENWFSLDAPRHFFIHTIESMKALSKKCNLKLKKYYYDSVDMQFWGSEQYKKGISLSDKNSIRTNKL